MNLRKENGGFIVIIGDLLDILGLKLSYESKQVPEIIENLHEAYQTYVCDLKKRNIEIFIIQSYKEKLEIGHLCVEKYERFINKIRLIIDGVLKHIK